jgi:hypothetical protein
MALGWNLGTTLPAARSADINTLGACCQNTFPHLHPIPTGRLWTPSSVRLPQRFKREPQHNGYGAGLANNAVTPRLLSIDQAAVYLGRSKASV